MAVTLSPWPTTPQAKISAVDCLGQVLNGSLTDVQIDRLGKVSSELVEDYAPGAPSCIKDQCVEMIAGYLNDKESGTVRSETIADNIVLEYQTNHSAFFRNCGAEALLTNWKVRRAGVIG